LFDRFGILRSDEPSKSSDSVPIEDPSLFLTDDDTSARVLDANTVSGKFCKVVIAVAMQKIS